jgi:hypothetical protein
LGASRPNILVDLEERRWLVVERVFEVRSMFDGLF